jgi:tRNA (mo5U34)-methyltransferase
VQRQEISIDELTPDRFGRFDLVFAGYLPSEIRDPQLTLERAYSVSSAGLLLASRIDKELEPLKDLGPFPDPALAKLATTESGALRWLPNIELLRTMLAVAGFDPVDEVARFDVRGDEPEMHAVVLRGHVPQRHSWETFTRGGELVAPPNPPVRRRSWRLGSIEVDVTMPADEANRLTHHPAYRFLVGPAVRMTSARQKQATAVAISTAGDANGEYNGHTADMVAETADPTARSLTQEISGIGWYHTINLGHGVITKGFVDHRDQLHHYQLPDSLAGMRCLDVATFDGYFAFEMERRGADEVIALDITTFAEVDMPALLAQEELIRRRTEGVVGTGFRVAHRTLGSRVKRVEGNVYDLTPSVHGKFDFVLLSDLVVHLRDPMLALRRIFSVCSGTFVLSEMFHPGLEGLEGPVSQYTMRMPYSSEVPMELWWIHSVGSMKAMLEAAGFESVEEVSRFELNSVMEGCDKVVLRARVPKAQQVRLMAAETESHEVAPVGAG